MFVKISCLFHITKILSGNKKDLKSIYGKNKQKYYIIGFANNYNRKTKFDNIKILY